MMKKEPVTESRSERGLAKIEDDFPDLSLEGFELQEHRGPCEGTEVPLRTQSNRLLHQRLEHTSTDIWEEVVPSDDTLRRPLRKRSGHTSRSGRSVSIALKPESPLKMQNLERDRY